MLASLAIPALAADLRLPEKAVAGQAVSIGTSGSGEGTLYIVGPGTAIKRQVKLGGEVRMGH